MYSANMAPEHKHSDGPEALIGQQRRILTVSSLHLKELIGTNEAIQFSRLALNSGQTNAYSQSFICSQKPLALKSFTLQLYQGLHQKKFRANYYCSSTTINNYTHSPLLIHTLSLQYGAVVCAHDSQLTKMAAWILSVTA
jgi:hypothetical protein